MLYPNFEDLAALKKLKHRARDSLVRSLASASAGNHRSNIRGQGLEFDFVREYVPGDDDIRNIDWRVTARMGSPHLKIYKEEKERQVTIAVDMNASMRFGTRNTFKSIQAARAASLLGWRGIASQDKISACLFGDLENQIQLFPPRRGQKSFFNLLKALSTPPVEHHHIPLEKALQELSRFAQTGSLTYLISDFMDLDSHFNGEASLSRLKRKGGLILISINDPADQEIPPVGIVGFCANPARKIFVNTESHSGRNAYAAQWQENRLRLRRLASRLNIHLIELTTESNIERDLLFELDHIGIRRK